MLRGLSFTACIQYSIRKQKHIVPQRFHKAPWPSGIECYGIRHKRYGFYLKELRTVGAFFPKFTDLCFLGNEKICHCTRKSSDIQRITDINPCHGFAWPVNFYNRVFIHLYFHSISYFPHLYLMPLAVTEMKRIDYTMLRF